MSLPSSPRPRTGLFEDYRKRRGLRVRADRGRGDEVIAFAQRFDPQSIHTDPVRPPRSVQRPDRERLAQLGLLIASFRCALSLAVASLACPAATKCAGSSRSGRGSAAIAGVGHGREVSRSKPDRGIVHSLVEGINQADEVVVSFKAMNRSACADPNRRAPRLGREGLLPRGILTVRTPSSRPASRRKPRRAGPGCADVQAQHRAQDIADAARQ